MNITANQICCCESTGDATHETIEGEPEACTADDMNGSCVALSECGIDNSITRLEVDTPVTVDSALLAIWKTKDPKAYGALRIKIAGKHAKLEVDGSNGEGFTKAATLPTTGAIVVTAKADGTAEVSNGATTWLLSQEYRYLSIKVRKRK